MKKKLHISKEKLRLWIEENETEIYSFQCLNLVHFYAVQYATEQLLRGNCKDHELLKPLDK